MRFPEIHPCPANSRSEPMPCDHCGATRRRDCPQPRTKKTPPPASQQAAESDKHPTYKSPNIIINRLNVNTPMPSPGHIHATHHTHEGHSFCACGSIKLNGVGPWRGPNRPDGRVPQGSTDQPSFLHLMVPKHVKAKWVKASRHNNTKLSSWCIQALNAAALEDGPKI
jgi:hypothetical protein